MKPSRLELQNYFVTALSLTANRSFDGRKPLAACASDLRVEPFVLADESDARHWQVTLKIAYRPGPDVNAPYHFAVEIAGLFQVTLQVPDENVKWLVETNATSVLYSSAREILRSVMSNGPYPPLLLPTLSFYEPRTTQAEATDAASAEPRPADR